MANRVFTDKVFLLFIAVPNRRSPSPSVRKAPSLDLIAGPYLTGQWPRDFLTPTHQHAMRDKTTQV